MRIPLASWCQSPVPPLWSLPVIGLVTALGPNLTKGRRWLCGVIAVWISGAMMFFSDLGLSFAGNRIGQVAQTSLTWAPPTRNASTLLASG